MKRMLLVRLATGLLLLLGGGVAQAQNPPGPPQNTLQKIRDDLYMIEGDGGNVTVYLTNEGVILVDDKLDRDFNDIIAKVRSLSDKPVKYVFNTHHHFDHTGSNEKLLITAEIIAHRNARANMAMSKQAGLPRFTFADDFQVFLGGKEVQAHYYGRGHTNGDAVVYFPALRVVATGDLFTATPNFPPLIDYAGGGSVNEWTRTLEEMLKLDFDTVIPGHGPVARREDVVKYRLMIESMRNRVRSMLREHKSKDEIAKMLAADYHWQELHMRRSLDGLLTELH